MALNELEKIEIALKETHFAECSHQLGTINWFQVEFSILTFAIKLLSSEDYVLND